MIKSKKVGIKYDISLLHRINGINERNLPLIKANRCMYKHYLND